MLYDCIKIIHVISASLLLTSMSYCFMLWKLNRHDAAIILNRIQTQNWVIIIPFAIFQLASGFTLISVKHYNLSELWISGSIISFILVIISWFAFVYFLLCTPNTLFRKLQTIMMILCTFSILSMVFFMANRVV